MNRIKRNEDLSSPAGISQIKTGRKISYTVFQKAIKLNTDLRQQVKDRIDLGLYEYAFQINMGIIRAARENADKQTTEIMLKFLKGVGEYQILRKVIHRNRIIKTLAQKDTLEHGEMLSRVQHLRLV